MWRLFAAIVAMEAMIVMTQAFSFTTTNMLHAADLGRISSARTLTSTVNMVMDPPAPLFGSSGIAASSSTTPRRRRVGPYYAL